MRPPSFIFMFWLVKSNLFAQPLNIPIAENLVVEGIPALSTNLMDETKNYTESRSASFASWHPLKKEVLISTRFGNSNQLHYVKMPGGDRKQLTFFDEPVYSATFEPVNGNYFLFLKDTGGNEFSQIYRYDIATSKTTLLTDGKRSQNGDINWNSKGDKIAYGSTRRNGKDRDIYILNPLDPASDKQVSENSGDWKVIDWSADDTRLLMQEEISVNEKRLYLLDIGTGVKTRLLPEKDERSSYNGVAFQKMAKACTWSPTKTMNLTAWLILILLQKK
jgi:Tol biopolymer transport system component